MKKILLASALVLAVSAGQSHAFSISFDYQLATDGSGKTSEFVPANNVNLPGASYIVETFDQPGTVNRNVSVVNGSVFVPAGAGFNTLNPATDIIIHSGSFQIQKGNTSSGANPGGTDPVIGDTTFYAFAPAPGGTGAEVEIDYAAYLFDNSVRISYLGLYYGSIDTYNNLSFYSGQTLISGGTEGSPLFDGILTGSEILAAMGGTSGNQSAPGSNVYVNLFFDAEDPLFTSFRFTTTGIAFEVDNIVAGFTPVPEPATMLLFGAGLAGLAGIRRKRNK